MASIHPVIEVDRLLQGLRKILTGRNITAIVVSEAVWSIMIRIFPMFWAAGLTDLQTRPGHEGIDGVTVYRVDGPEHYRATMDFIVRVYGRSEVVLLALRSERLGKSI